MKGKMKAKLLGIRATDGGFEIDVAHLEKQQTPPQLGESHQRTFTLRPKAIDKMTQLTHLLNSNSEIVLSMQLNAGLTAVQDFSATVDGTRIEFAPTSKEPKPEPKVSDSMKQYRLQDDQKEQNRDGFYRLFGVVGLIIVVLFIFFSF